MRVKSRWNKQAREQSLEDIAKAVALICWQIATEGVLNLENQGSQTRSHEHRLHIAGEFLAFLLQVSDRLVYAQMNDEQRQQFVTTLGLRMADIYADNQRDISATPGDYRKIFIDLLNQRAEDYSHFTFRHGEAGFDFLRYFGEQVETLMEEKPWVSQQIVGVEGPEAIKILSGGIKNLFRSSKRSV